MIGDYTFTGKTSNFFSPTQSSPMHYVHPHFVSAYARKDGTFVNGFLRDGDGNTGINRAFGYFSRNEGSLIKMKNW